MGATLRFLRRIQRKTLLQIADAAGISETYLSALERGLKPFSNARTSTLESISNALGLPLAAILLLGMTKEETSRMESCLPNVRDIVTEAYFRIATGKWQFQ